MHSPRASIMRYLAAVLSHRQSVWFACRPCNIHAVTRQLHEAEDDQRGQKRPLGLPRVHTEEVARYDLFPMSLQKLFPGRVAQSFWSWLDAVSFQNVPDGVVCQIVAEVGQGSLYPPIAPRAILFSHADSQSCNFWPR